MRHIHSGVFAILALAVPTAAQMGSDRWTIEVSSIIISPSQPSTRLRFLAAFAPHDTAFGAARWDIHATEPGWSDPMVLLNPPFNQGTISAPFDSRRRVREVHFPPIVIADPTNPLPVYEVTWSTSDFRPREVDIRTQSNRYDVYMPSAPYGRSAIPGLIEGRITLTIIPAPHAGLILTGGLLYGCRRGVNHRCTAEQRT